MKGLTRLALIAVAAVGMGLVASAPSYAIHKGAGGLVCGGCHTMHNSQGRTSLDGVGTSPSDIAGGGSLILLRANIAGREEIHNLCLQCHSQGGSRGTDLHAPHNQTAPKVLTGASTTWTDAASFKEIGAGGDFADACDNGSTAWTCADNDLGLGLAVGKGHSLGATSVTPPGSADVAGLDYLTCTNCHDPHGVNSNTTSTLVNNYRMLRKTPTGSGATAVTIANTWSPYGGITGVDDGSMTDPNYVPYSVGAVGVWPIIQGGATLTGVAATDTTKTNYYSNNIGAWCATCHDRWHEDNDTTNELGWGGDWKRHPVDNLLTDGSPNSGAAVPIINTAQYDTELKAAGFGVPVARDATTVGTNDVYYFNSGATDKVFCLSCHFPHGGPYNDMLRWNYTSGAIVAGEQTGNVVPSDDDPTVSGNNNARGCQLCHNRGGAW